MLLGTDTIGHSALSGHPREAGSAALYNHNRQCSLMDTKQCSCEIKTAVKSHCTKECLYCSVGDKIDHMTMHYLQYVTTSLFSMCVLWAFQTLATVSVTSSEFKITASQNIQYC